MLYFKKNFKNMANIAKNIEELKTISKFKIKVVANSKNNSIEFLEDFVKIKIKERAIEGKANKAIIEYLSDILSVPKSKIQILNGDKSSIKTIQITQ